MPEFPFPWYITQVRVALWNQWSKRLAGLHGECTLIFSILPNGGIVDVRAEESSGDAVFDLAALSAAQDAAPFPPLPIAFREPFLKVHASLTAQ